MPQLFKKMAQSVTRAKSGGSYVNVNWAMPSGGSTFSMPTSGSHQPQNRMLGSVQPRGTCPYCGCEYEKGHTLSNCKQCGAPKVNGGIK